jgi:hypothetical protein
MTTSLLDVLVGLRMRLILAEQVGDPAKGEQLANREVELVGQLLFLPELPEGSTSAALAHHSLHDASGERHAIRDGAVRRVEVLDSATDEVVLYAKCTGELTDRGFLGGLQHNSAQCCVHEVHVDRRRGRQPPGS